MQFLEFLTQFMKHPEMVGSIAPSSKFLIRRMLSPISWNDAQVVIELGCGTGVITDEIYRSCPSPAQFLLFERNPHFRKLISSRFPSLPVYEDAGSLDKVLSSINQKADVIISSLPFANFPEDKQNALVEVVYNGLKENGVFITYQYSLHMKRKLKERFPKFTVSFELVNLPPAWVYTCHKVQ